MARVFDDGSSQFLSYNSAIITAAPFTMACWFNSDDDAANQTLMSIASSTSGVNHWHLQIRGGVAGDKVTFHVRDDIANVALVTTSGYTANTWHHACAIEAGNSSRSVYIDGGSSGSNSTTVSPSVNRTAIGLAWDQTPDTYMSGAIAEAAIWDVALSGDELAMLALGISPMLVCLKGLVSYWPLLRTDQDLVSGYDMTANGGPTWANHPPDVRYPIYRPWRWAAAATVVVPLKMMHYARLRRAG